MATALTMNPMPVPCLCSRSSSSSLDSRVKTTPSTQLLSNMLPPVPRLATQLSLRSSSLPPLSSTDLAVEFILRRSATMMTTIRRGMHLAAMVQGGFLTISDSEAFGGTRLLPSATFHSPRPAFRSRSRSPAWT